MRKLTCFHPVLPLRHQPLDGQSLSFLLKLFHTLEAIEDHGVCCVAIDRTSVGRCHRGIPVAATWFPASPVPLHGRIIMDIQRSIPRRPGNRVLYDGSPEPGLRSNCPADRNCTPTSASVLCLQIQLRLILQQPRRYSSAALRLKPNPLVPALRRADSGEDRCWIWPSTHAVVMWCNCV
jgi:hypothetical protein